MGGDVAPGPASHRVPLAALTAEQEEAWRDLAGRAEEPNPFLEPDYVLPLAEALGHADAVELLVVADGPHWLACLPLHRTAAWHRIPLSNAATYRGSTLLGLLGTPLVDAGRLPDAAAGLVDGLLADRRTWLTALEWLHAEGPVRAALEVALRDRGRRPVRFEGFERAALHRRDAGDYLEQTMSSKHRRELRRQARKLGEDRGEVAVEDLAGDPAGPQGLIELEGRSHLAGQDGGQPLAADPAQRRFFEAMCERFAADGRLQVLTLRTGDDRIAYKLNLRAGDGLFMVKIAFDETEELRRFSPGIQLEAAMLERFHADAGLQWMDSCADPNNSMINRLWPERRGLVTLVVTAPGLRGTVTELLVRALRAIRNRRNGDLT